MTKEEFIRNSNAAARQATIVSLSALLLLVALSGALFWVIEYVVRPSTGQIYQPLLIIVLLSPMMLISLVLHGIRHHRNRRFGLLCRGCEKPLIDMRREIAVATGHCGNCGAGLFDDGDTPIR